MTALRLTWFWSARGKGRTLVEKATFDSQFVFTDVGFTVHVVANVEPLHVDLDSGEKTKQKCKADHNFFFHLPPQII